MHTLKLSFAPIVTLYQFQKFHEHQTFVSFHVVQRFVVHHSCTTLTVFTQSHNEKFCPRKQSNSQCDAAENEKFRLATTNRNPFENVQYFFLLQFALLKSNSGRSANQ